ncbi:hypothetical protein FF011L_08630 [Roseimaritima multifibrata]|uniref:Uncharacterized protein n=1 Tax=Roseimaritima multifibrata TaxID=1930274 RepID=A0A517MBH2_9BACT|nr:hypothetical protein [Roseimaritima multifibrata]QDS92127.1 hypothetical protein FF011L_08630 [Roseimaritima multifibrata]
MLKQNVLLVGVFFVLTSATHWSIPKAQGQDAQASPVGGHSPTGFYVDPSTGNVYRKVQRTIERPVTQYRNETRERTIYRHQVSTQMQSEKRTYYSPRVEYGMAPYWKNRWNPFVQPTLAYQYVPMTRWEARSETIHRPTTVTKLVPEKQVDTVPVQVTENKKEAVVHYELVHGGPAASLADNTVIARLQSYQPQNQIAAASPTLPAPTLPSTYSTASGIVALQSPSERSGTQTGMRPSVLQPSTLPPPMIPANVASNPILDMLR